LYGRHGEFLLHGGGLPGDGSFDQVLDRAISGKEAKRSDGKDDTVLIIDNRTSVYFVDEVTNAIAVLAARLRRSPFKEIWFYNGYCSDDDGNNGEYTMAHMKISDERFQLMLDASKKGRKRKNREGGFR